MPLHYMFATVQNYLHSLRGQNNSHTRLILVTVLTILPQAGTIDQRLMLRRDFTLTQSIDQRLEGAAAKDTSVSVAFQGERGAFGDEAVIAYFGKKAEPLPYRSFSDVFQAVAAGKNENRPEPVENSEAGRTQNVDDFLLQHELFCIGGIIQPTNQCLLCLPGQQ